MKQRTKFLITVIVFYLLFSFANLDINFSNWPETSRILFAIFAIPLSFMCLLFLMLFEDID